jgi:hypothetical protein
MSGPQLLQFSFAGGGPWRALDVNGDADGMPIAVLSVPSLERSRHEPGDSGHRR